jgi:hypothetical protein
LFIRSFNIRMERTGTGTEIETEIETETESEMTEKVMKAEDVKEREKSHH